MQPLAWLRVSLAGQNRHAWTAAAAQLGGTSGVRKRRWHATCSIMMVKGEGGGKPNAVLLVAARAAQPRQCLAIGAHWRAIMHACNIML
jgi:hypothetical protein